MTRDRFLNMLGDPDLLAAISYQELNTLALAYPYAHNLRYLLALKAQQDHHPEFDRALAAAAAYSLHRPKLFQLIAPQRVSVIEEVLELKAIEALQRELEARVPVNRTAEAPETPVAQVQPTPLSEPAQAPDVVFQTSEPTEKTAPAEPPTGFGDWLDQFNLQPLSPRPATGNQPEKPARKPAPAPSVAQTFAERSVAEREEVE